jgi:hypothetical protein
MRAHAEFRRHRAADSPAHIIGFLSQWKRYLDQLPASPDAGGAFRGARMDPTVFEKVRACPAPVRRRADDGADVAGAAGPDVRAHACDEGDLEARRPAPEGGWGRERIDGALPMSRTHTHITLYNVQHDN